MKKVPLPEWCVSVKKAMVERDDIASIATQGKAR